VRDEERRNKTRKACDDRLRKETNRDFEPVIKQANHVGTMGG
jgi:hypothetical protein